MCGSSDNLLFVSVQDKKQEPNFPWENHHPGSSALFPGPRFSYN